ncbi:unnamed protein product [Ectocarpus sp. 8 AP-2014]
MCDTPCHDRCPHVSCTSVPVQPKRSPPPPSAHARTHNSSSAGQSDDSKWVFAGPVLLHPPFPRLETGPKQKSNLAGRKPTLGFLFYPEELVLLLRCSAAVTDSASAREHHGHARCLLPPCAGWRWEEGSDSRTTLRKKETIPKARQLLRHTHQHQHLHCHVTAPPFQTQAILTRKKSHPQRH